MKKVVVFGGSGFIGSHTADELTEKGFDVVVFDRTPSKFLGENQKMIVGDILDQNVVLEAVKGAEYVYHFAGIADIKEAQDDPAATFKANVLSTIHILEACKFHKVKRFMYASTIYVYSEHGSFYRSSKQSAELIIDNYNKIYGLKYTIMRYGSLYGKRANHFNFINNIIRQAILDKKIIRKGDGSEVRDYINVLDAARASVNLLTEKSDSEYVIITGTQTMKVKELLHMIKEMFNHEIQIEFTESKLEEHYEITPYSFRPKVAKKYVLDYYHDLGQGVLDSVYDSYQNLVKEGEIKNVDLPESLNE